MDSIGQSKMKSLVSSRRSSFTIALVVVIAVGLAGVLLVLTRASGFFASAEPENGTLSGNALLVSDSSATSGKAIQFTAPLVIPPPTTGSGVCPAFPAFPDEKCTGYKHNGITVDQLTTDTTKCPQNLNVAGKTYDRCKFVNGVSVGASNVTITNSLVLGRVNAPYTRTNLVLQDVEIDGQNSDPNGQSGIGDYSYTCVRCDVHGTGRGAALGDDVIIKDSYFHDFYYVNGAHQTAVGNNGAAHNQIIHNNLLCNSDGCSAALSLYGDFGQVNDILIQNNLFNTTGSFCTYAGGNETTKAYPNGTNIRYVDNVFGKKYHTGCGIYGPVSFWNANSTGNVWTGNIWQDGSGAVSP